jgi:hypothetical protein
MSQLAKLGVRALRVGGYYGHVNGLFVRRIDVIQESTVHYQDQHGRGVCSRDHFVRVCDHEVPPGQVPPELLRSPSLEVSEFTLRDEANALTAFAFRNGFLEDLHAGRHTPLLEDASNSRITDPEMKRLMIEASKKLEELLRLRWASPAEYEEFVRSYNRRYCRGWERK